MEGGQGHDPSRELVQDTHFWNNLKHSKECSNTLAQCSNSTRARAARQRTYPSSILSIQGSKELLLQTVHQGCIQDTKNQLVLIGTPDVDKGLVGEIR